jgi:N-acetylglucosamine kinase-like BadF-type ATPase
MPSRPAVLAVDSGNTKIDAALIARDGSLLGVASGRGCSFAPGDEERSMAALTAVLEAVCERAGIRYGKRPLADTASLCLAGADLPVDDRRLARAIGPLELGKRIVLHNDTFAVLRAGTTRPWGIGVVCGTGLNCSGIAPNGRTVRFWALGELSGDPGGGGWMGLEALKAAIRARDLRDPPTRLADDVPAHFGLRTPFAVMQAIHTGQISYHRLSELAPLVFRAAKAGDAVAIGIAVRTADQVAAMVVSAARRLHLVRSDVEVALGGAIMRGGHRFFLDRIAERVHERVPDARIAPISSPPVVGAGLIGLDLAGAPARAAARLRDTLTDDRLRAEEG